MVPEPDTTSDPSPSILGVATALPPHHASQEAILAALEARWAALHHNPARLGELHRAVAVSGRYLALPLEAYAALGSFAAANAAWRREALPLAEVACRRALDRAGLTPADVDHLYFTTVTGLDTPSLDGRLMNRLRLRPDVKRTPLFGLGCVGGAAGLARASDALRGAPGKVALLVAVELCSLTLQRDDLSVANLIATGLFGDGAAAVVLAGRGGGAAGPRVRATRSVFYPETEDAMGWEIVDTGFKVVLSAAVPELVRAHIGADVDAFLADHGRDRAGVRHWIAHTGGPRVLEAVASALALPAGALDRSWRSLAEVGNLSSASVLFVLDDLLRARIARPGDAGVLLAMGPGFCAELVLLAW
jgi:alkylresorcinol/alkylpyrone synthase